MYAALMNRVRVYLVVKTWSQALTARSAFRPRSSELISAVNAAVARSIEMNVVLQPWVFDRYRLCRRKHISLRKEQALSVTRSIAILRGVDLVATDSAAAACSRDVNDFR
jgi:hypothetical protein